KPSMLAQKTRILKNHLLPAFGKLKLDQITPAAIDAYKASKLEEVLNPGTINNHLMVLSAVLSLAIADEVISKKPKIKRLRVTKATPEFLDFDEANQFLAATDPEWLPMVTTALKTGLRIGELRALKWEDVDLVTGQLHVRRTLWDHAESKATLE